MHISHRSNELNISSKTHTALEELTLALGDELFIGNPILAQYNKHDLIGFYTGDNERSLKMGFAINLNPQKIEGYVNYDTSFAKTEKYNHLVTFHTFTNNGTDFETKIQEIPPHTPLILVQWPNKSFIGFWNGIDTNQRPRLDIYHDKEKDEYGDIFHIAPFLCRGETPSALNYKTPSLKDIIQIKLLHTNIINPEIYK